jgi:hypothetical protein
VVVIVPVMGVWMTMIVCRHGWPFPIGFSKKLLPSARATQGWLMRARITLARQ